MVKQNKVPLIYTSILYFCGLFLFLEWLYPMKELAETSNINVFIIYTIYCFLISILNLKWWTSFLIKGAGLLFIVNGIFFDGSILNEVWWNQLYIELTFNIQALFSQQWYDVTNLFQSVLFLLLIWLMSYLIHYWFFLMKQIFLFVLLTFIYITIIDTFTDYNAQLSIVRVFIISFMSLGFANFFKEVNNESIRFTWTKKAPAWVIPIVVIVLFTSIAGYAAPKFDPQWPDPMPFLKGISENAESLGTNIRKVGYGENDSELGGSFSQDYTPVFQAEATKEHYWRIETKDVYTGRGWESSKKHDYEKINNQNVPIKTFTENVETEELEVFVDFEEKNTINKLVYPYGLSQIEAFGNSELLLDVHSGAIEKKANDNQERYKLTYLDPLFDITALRSANKEDPLDIHDQYTTLPSELPSRVFDMAEEITRAHDNRYDKARAIEQYFGRNGFTYQTSGVPFPGEGQDYVDQFLFDTKIGYCDNYSTSMVVMLRTLDIPARWVKGFTGGDKIVDNIGIEDESFDVYEITNANAHSWVEVYFSDVGWVPFEPTQGFSNTSNFEQSGVDQEEPNDTESEPEEAEVAEEELLIPEDKDIEVAEDTQDTKDVFQISWLYILSILTAIVLLLLFVLYKNRFRLKVIYLSRKFSKRGDAETYGEVYHHLLSVLSYNGFTKKPDQTLREYAKVIDQEYGSKEMGLLTNYYERMLYNNETKDIKVNELIELWRNLLKHVMN